jgi:hypothetical protein
MQKHKIIAGSVVFDKGIAHGLKVRVGTVFEIPDDEI